MRIKKHREAAVESAQRSLYLLTRLFGSISPAKKTARVQRIVPSATYPAPQRRVTRRVTSVAVVIWTIFVPIRMVEMATSKLSCTYKALSARRSPRSWAILRRMRPTDMVLVSATAKYAAHPSKTITHNHGNQLSLSIKEKSTPQFI